MRRYTPGTISLAVEYALELCATIDMRAQKTDYAEWLGKARHNLTVTVNRCIKAGLLARQDTPTTNPAELPESPAPEPVNTHMASDIAAAVTGYSPSVGVAHRVGAPPVKFSIAAVPVNGAHPGFSNGGSIANFAIIADPIRPLDRETASRREQVRVSELLGQGMFPDPTDKD